MLLVSGSYLGSDVLADVCLMCVSWTCTYTHIPGVLRFENGLQQDLCNMSPLEKINTFTAVYKLGKSNMLLRAKDTFYSGG